MFRWLVAIGFDDLRTGPLRLIDPLQHVGSRRGFWWRRFNRRSAFKERLGIIRRMVMTE